MPAPAAPKPPPSVPVPVQAGWSLQLLGNDRQKKGSEELATAMVINGGLMGFNGISW